MKKIGQGYFYNVFDIGNERVIKKQKKKSQIFFYIFRRNILPLRAYSEYKKALLTIPSIESSYKRLLVQVKDKELLGNPTFYENIEYEQDRVILTHDLFKKGTLQEQKNIIDAYVVLIKKCWAYGFHERVFNFTINTGVNSQGKLILIDFNEISFDKNDVRDDILRNIWEHRWSFTQLFFFGRSELREYYKEQMKKHITIEALEQLWGSLL